MKRTERQTCSPCKGEGYVSQFILRPDGYYDRAWALCGTCWGKGYVEQSSSDTPFLDYVREKSNERDSNSA